MLRGTPEANEGHSPEKSPFSPEALSEIDAIRGVLAKHAIGLIETRMADTGVNSFQELALMGLWPTSEELAITARDELDSLETPALDEHDRRMEEICETEYHEFLRGNESTRMGT